MEKKPNNTKLEQLDEDDASIVYTYEKTSRVGSEIVSNSKQLVMSEGTIILLSEYKWTLTISANILDNRMSHGDKLSGKLI